MQMRVFGEVFDSLDKFLAGRAAENNLPGKTASTTLMEGGSGLGDNEAGSF